MIHYLYHIILYIIKKQNVFNISAQRIGAYLLLFWLLTDKDEAKSEESLEMSTDTSIGNKTFNPICKLFSLIPVYNCK